DRHVLPLRKPSTGDQRVPELSNANALRGSSKQSASCENRREVSAEEVDYLPSIGRCGQSAHKTSERLQNLRIFLPILEVCNPNQVPVQDRKSTRLNSSHVA